MLETLRLTEEEMKDMIALSYKSKAIVNYYFGEGGKYEVLDSELRSYFTENYARFKYVILDKKDDDGNNGKTYDEYEENAPVSCFFCVGSIFVILFSVFNLVLGML